MAAFVPKLFAIVVVIAGMVPGGLLAQTSEPPAIVVSGTGVVAAAPDMASIRVGVISQASSAAEALNQNTEQMTAVMALLAEEGIETRDIQTSDFTVQPVYERRETADRPKIIGYNVRNMVHVRLRELSRLGALLDGLVGEGSNALQSLSFGLSDSSVPEKEAEALAVKDALARAEGMAEAAGLSLGPVLRIEAGGGPAPRPMMEMTARAADAGPVPVAAGELSFRAQVRVTIALRD